MLKISNLDSLRSYGKIANQFRLIDSDNNCEYFQSYDSMIIKIDHKTGKTYLDERYWDYSRTTGKYRNNFLGEDTKEIKAKIKSGEYQLVDLNR